MSAVIQAVLIVAAMSSLNSGLYSTGRVLRSLGMSKQAPKFTLKMSKSGVPWAGIVMTSIVFVFGSVLNALTPDAFEIAVEATSVMILLTWGTIFACQIRLRQLSDRGVVPASPFQAPGSPVHELHRAGLPRPGARRPGHLGLAGLAGAPAQDRASWSSCSASRSWRSCSPSAGARSSPRSSRTPTTGSKAVWSLNGPTYGADVSPDDLDKDKQDTTQLPG